MNYEAMVNAIKAKYAKNNEPGGRGKIDPYDSFMRSIVTSPETAIYKENGQFFKAAAPKAPLAGKELETHLREQLKKFLEFRRGKLEHVIDYDKSIEKQVAEFQISSDELTRYNELALIMESNRKNSEHGLKYVDAYIEKGVNINATLLNGRTPLHIACLYGNMEVAKRLVAANGIDVNKPDNAGRTPLYLACENGNLEVAGLLLASRANVNLPDKDGFTPLHFASYNGHTEVAGLLIDRGADIDAVTHDGVTPLYLASHKGNTEVVRLLIDRGADANLKTNRGRTPSDIARQNGHTKVLEILNQAANKQDPAQTSIDNSRLRENNKSPSANTAAATSPTASQKQGREQETAPVVGGRVSGCFGFGRLF
jgi:ankyrin repeat protein